MIVFRSPGWVKSEPVFLIQGGLKKAPYFVFHPKVVFYNFFSIFFRWCRQQAWEILLTPIWIQVDSTQQRIKTNWGVLCRKISSHDTAAMQKRFWQGHCTWWKDNLTFGGQILQDSKCGRCSQRPRSSIVWHNSWKYSEFTRTPWGFPQKINTPLSQETGILRTSVLRILHDDLRLFPYKIQILQRQTDQNKAERETFCKDISQRIENGPGLLDLNNLNDVDHCGLCGASATLPVSRNLATKRWIVLPSDTLSLPKSLLHCHCVRRTDFVTKYTSMIFIGCCVVNRPVGSILVSKESLRPAVYTTRKMWKKFCKIQLWDKKKIGRFFWTTL